MYLLTDTTQECQNRNKKIYAPNEAFKMTFVIHNRRVSISATNWRSLFSKVQQDTAQANSGNVCRSFCRPVYSVLLAPINLWLITLFWITNYRFPC